MTLPPGHPTIGAADRHGTLPTNGRYPHGNVPSSGTARSAGSIAGTITLSPKLQVSPSDVLYLIAKRGGSTLAVRRIEKLSFPLSFEISAADSMMAGAGFEGPLDLVARVSKTGDAIPSKGDIEGSAREVAVPSKGVAITIDSVRE
jgi:cytochrome c-type biogenesis protein CcmH